MYEKSIVFIFKNSTTCTTKELATYSNYIIIKVSTHKIIPLSIILLIYENLLILDSLSIDTIVLYLRKNKLKK